MERHEKMRAARKTLGLTQEEVARRLGADQSDVSRWERGGTTPAIERWPAIATLYGVSLDWLFGDDSSPATLAREVAGQLRDLGLAEVRRRLLAFAPPPGDGRLQVEREPSKRQRPK
jgi:transcriptional regulator with XRE-family HTH domain